MDLHPSQFEVDESWILFRLNRMPVVTSQDEPAVCLGLMDAASCFILSVTTIQGITAVVRKEHLRQLLKKGWAHKERYPSRLFTTPELINDDIEEVAESEGISVVTVLERQLESIIGEAQTSFEESLFQSGSGYS